MSLATVTNVKSRRRAIKDARSGEDTVQPPLISSAPVRISKPSLDCPLDAALTHLTGGISPAALGQADIDWLQHLLFSPDKQLELLDKAARKWGALSPVLSARVHRS